MEKIKVPKGLRKCEVCGEYKGKVQERDLPSPDSEIGYETKDGRGYFEVSCLCEGIPCRSCGKNKVRKPISNYYDPRDGRILHTPAMSTLKCGPCERERK